MDTIKTISIFLVVGILFALAYGGFTYTNEAHRTDINALKITLDGNHPETNSAQK